MRNFKINSLYGEMGSIANNNINDSFFKNIDKDDSDLQISIKDINRDIRKIKVTSQSEYNTNDLSNNTLYFINDINESLSVLNNVTDIAVSNTLKNKDKNFAFPEKLWILTKDEDVEEVDLYCTTFKSAIQVSDFKLVKRFPDCLDGRIAFDGNFKVAKDGHPIFVTKGDPFVILITSNYELYAIPNIKYDLKYSGEAEDKAYCIVRAPLPEEVEPSLNVGTVTACSIERGYFSELSYDEDQGMVISYGLTDISGNYSINYIQYGYSINPSTKKPFVGWGTANRIATLDSPVYWIALRRLTDYRLGLTYNYIKNNVSYGIFKYSQRTFSGLAYRPETIEINPIPKIGPILYGAVRNDNVAKVEEPYLSPGDEAETSDNGIKIYFELLNTDGTNLFSENLKKINIQILDEKNLDDETEDINIKDIIDIGLQITNDYPYPNYVTTRDPFFGDKTAAKAIINTIQSTKNKIILTLKSDNIPMTPFSIHTEINKKWKNRINIRYVGNDFNGLVNEETGKEKIINGWFALENVKTVTIGSIHYNNIPSSEHIFFDFTKEISSPLVLLSYQSGIITRTVTFNVNIEGNYNINNDLNIFSDDDYEINKEGIISIGSSALSIKKPTISWAVGSNINV